MINVLQTHVFASQDVNWRAEMDYLWIIVMFLSTVWTVILTAPIHCRGPIGEQVIFKPVQTHLCIGCPEGEYIFSKFLISRWTIAQNI